ncbi:hypothetical protein OG471_00600 [Streptomyces sp. NBC_01336]|uniref:hypothetical protein n=1 Tax=Streptomyces sp. NBC_01336 TaxID=2903829 RepID=UPI002E0F8459|nr:hypothetical protein OG471_00600 [Streptomyces sp. NBC_01336]
MSCSEDAGRQNSPGDLEDGARPDTSLVKLHSFILCKYDKARRRGDIDDWTDHSDIGASFDGRVLTAEEYQRTEDRYIAAAHILARAAGASRFTLRNVFLHSPPPDWLGEVYEGRIVDMTSALRMLRGHMSGDAPAAWFESEKMCMMMGFDFYMHVQIPERALASLDEIEEMGLFVLGDREQDEAEDEEVHVSRHADDDFWTEVAERLAVRSSAQQQEARTLVVERWAGGILGRRLWLVAADDLAPVAASVKRQALISAFIDPEIHATSRGEVARAVEAARRSDSDDDGADVVIFPLAGDRELHTVTVEWDAPLPDDGGLPPGQEFGVFPWPAKHAVCLEAIVPGDDGCVTARWVASSTS